MSDLLAVYGPQDTGREFLEGLSDQWHATIYEGCGRHRACLLGVCTGSGPYHGGMKYGQSGGVVWSGQPIAADPNEVGRLIEAYPLDDALEIQRRVGGVLAYLRYEAASRRLVAVRDGAGLVPMWWARVGGATYATTKASLLAAVMPDAEMDPRRSVAFLLGSVDCARNDFLDGVERIRPGETAAWHSDSTVPTYSTYWDPVEIAMESRSVKPAELRMRLSRVLGAVGGDGVAYMASSGLDSTALVALEGAGASPGARATSTGAPVVATMALEDFPELNEAPAARRIARALNLPSWSYDISEDGPLARVDCYQPSDPMGPVFHPLEQTRTRFLRELRAAQGVDRAITGFGADVVLFTDASRRAASRLSRFGRRMREGVGRIRKRLRSWFLPQTPEALEYVWRDSGRWVVPVHGWEGVEQRPICSVTGGFRRFHQEWRWELAVRSFNREMRRSGVDYVLPYVDPRVWEGALSIAPGERASASVPKRALSRAVESVLPTGYESLRKSPVFDAFVERSLTRELGGARVRHLIGESIPRIDRDRFLSAFDGYCSYVDSRSSGPPAGSFPIWFTVSYGLWRNSVSAGKYQKPCLEVEGRLSKLIRGQDGVNIDGDLGEVS